MPFPPPSSLPPALVAQRMPLRRPVRRGVYELGWYAIDGQSVCLVAIDSTATCIAYERVTTPDDYNTALVVLTEALNARDPVPLQIVT